MTMNDLSLFDQDAIDALATPEPEGLDVRNIPGVHTAANSGDKAGWRAIRGKTTSATTVTTIAGTNPFMTRRQLWEQSVLGFPAPPFTDYQRRFMAYGTEAEPELVAHANGYVAQAKAERDREPFVLTHGYVVDSATDPKYGATPDAFRFVGGGVQEGSGTLELAEFKTGSKAWGGTVPKNYADQVQWQMMVTGAARVLCIGRQVKRDRQGNVTAVLGHEEIWVDRDEKRIAELIDAVEDWKANVAAGIPPWVEVSLEDSFDDTPEAQAQKEAVRQALSEIEQADSELAKVAEWTKRRTAALAIVKAHLVAVPGVEVVAEYGGMGAKLVRSKRVGYDVDRLTVAQRNRIRTTTPVDTLRVGKA